jgi:hypothetical protein
MSEGGATCMHCGGEVDADDGFSTQLGGQPGGNESESEEREGVEDADTDQHQRVEQMRGFANAVLRRRKGA